MKRLNKKDFALNNDPIRVAPGEMLATLRTLQELTQSQLAKIAGMSQANISNMESGRQQIGRERALVLAKALKVHPSVIMFPNYQVGQEAA
jgi:transcriptional regulator with XRE-family HTH domain